MACTSTNSELDTAPLLRAFRYMTAHDDSALNAANSRALSGLRFVVEGIDANGHLHTRHVAWPTSGGGAPATFADYVHGLERRDALAIDCSLYVQLASVRPEATAFELSLPLTHVDAVRHGHGRLCFLQPDAETRARVAHLRTLPRSNPRSLENTTAHAGQWLLARGIGPVGARETCYEGLAVVGPRLWPLEHWALEMREGLARDLPPPLLAAPRHYELIAHESVEQRGSSSNVGTVVRTLKAMEVPQ